MYSEFVKSVLLIFSKLWANPEFKAFLNETPIQEVCKGSITSFKKWGSKSPKLSKVLRTFGLSEKQISEVMAFAVTTNPVQTRLVIDNERELRAQGNSIHFSSCQATDARAKFHENEPEKDLFYVQVDEDVRYLGKSLFMWVAGNPMYIDGEGYRARAKVRVVFTDYTCSKPLGLYIDKVYGDQKLLYREIGRLEYEWMKISFSRGWEATPILVIDPLGKEGFVPSADGGYQDSLTFPRERFAPFKFNNNVVGLIKLQADFDRKENAGLRGWSLSDVGLGQRIDDLAVIPEAEYYYSNKVISSKERQAIQRNLKCSEYADYRMFSTYHYILIEDEWCLEMTNKEFCAYVSATQTWKTVFTYL